jgi:hypothetical protein
MRGIRLSGEVLAVEVAAPSQKFLSSHLLKQAFWERNERGSETVAAIVVQVVHRLKPGAQAQQRDRAVLSFACSALLALIRPQSAPGLSSKWVPPTWHVADMRRAGAERAVRRAELAAGPVAESRVLLETLERAQEINPGINPLKHLLAALMLSSTLTLGFLAGSARRGK